ncbi:MAG: hypothetical protein NC245_13765 [Muribaculum sp.]|nr:hypothetical protein [Muribaculum sp.]
MSDMMKQFVTQELAEQIRKKYPHMQYPSILYAKVMHVKPAEGQYEVVLKILDKNGQPDNRFPEIPRVATDMAVDKNDIVVVALLYGEMIPYIIGRAF